MAIDTILPAANQTVQPASSVSFIVDDTYTSLVIKYQSSTALESVYNSGAGGAQSGYTVTVVNAGGRDTFTFTRDAGWETDPLQLSVTENETGAQATTTWTYDLFPTTEYPEGMNPYNSQGELFLILQNNGITIAGDIGILNAGANITATADGNGRVTLSVGSGTGDVTAENSPNSGEFGKWTSPTGIEGRTKAEYQADLDVESGTDFDPAGTDNSPPWVEDDFTPTLGQLTFILSVNPTDPISLSLHVNGIEAQETTDYTVSGTNLTWLDTDFSFVTSDRVVIQYR